MPGPHPDLAFTARFVPRSPVTARTFRFIRGALGVVGHRRPRSTALVEVTDVVIPGPPDHPDLTVRVYHPRTASGPVPALVWIHGGGYVIGTRYEEDRHSTEIAARLGVCVVSVEYRLAPEHPFPAALEDCHAALRWVGHGLGGRVDATRIAVGGASAGAGLAAGLVLAARDRGGPAVAFQLLVYPMLDDRTVLAPEPPRGYRLWGPRSNRFGWQSYLGASPGSADVSPYAAPARCDDLGGLPPAWLGVGTTDLFLDEDRTYAERLREAGVPCELVVVDGAYHGFDNVSPRATVSRRFRESYLTALEAALDTRGSSGGDRPASEAPRPST